MFLAVPTEAIPIIGKNHMLERAASSLIEVNSTHASFLASGPNDRSKRKP